MERVIIAFSKEPVDELLALLRQLRAFPVQIDLVPRLFELVGPRVTVHSVEGLPLLGLPPNHASPVARALKRAIDIAVSGLALIALAPLFAYIALRIRLDSDGPVFFRQTRLGTNMKEFTALKFRTMKVDTDQSVHQAAVRRSSVGRARIADEAAGVYKLERTDAVTGFGRGLRRTSLDELPQLINVLRGDMSLVGPRPCIPYETENFEPHHLERFAMPQGITGLWQVTARANCTFHRGAGHGCRLRARLVAGPRSPPAAAHAASVAPPASVNRVSRAFAELLGALPQTQGAAGRTGRQGSLSNRDQNFREHIQATSCDRASPCVGKGALVS